MDNVVAFQPKSAPPANLHVIPDVPANHEREGQGPPIGVSAWSCIDCASFAFYATLSGWHCYACHRPQSF